MFATAELPTAGSIAIVGESTKFGSAGGYAGLIINRSGIRKNSAVDGEFWLNSWEFRCVGGVLRLNSGSSEFSYDS
jgi:hypothetical protein